MIKNMSNDYLRSDDKNFIRQDLKARDLAYDLGYRINKEGTEFICVPEGYNPNITIKDKSFKCVRFYYNNKLYCCTIASLQALQKFGKEFGQSKAIHINGDRLDDSYDNISTFSYNRYLNSIAVTKICSVCGRELPAEQFNFNGRTIDYRTRSNICKDCATKKWYPAKEFVKSYKEKHKCIVCGESDENCLDFHHVDKDSKKFSISSVLHDNTHSCKSVIEELNKTCVLCSNCHRKLHGGTLGVDIEFLRANKVNITSDRYEDNS